MIPRYITTKQKSEAVVIEKNSKFIANVFPVESIQDIEKEIYNIKKQHYNARHHCFAYQLQKKPLIQKYSDDGEPQGTAGKPILDVLVGNHIQNTLVIVTRYFGGVLLGTGGLIRAYTKAAQQGIEEAGLIEIVPMQCMELQLDYTLNGKIQHLLKEKDYWIEDINYMEYVLLSVGVLPEQVESFQKWILEEFNAAIKVTPKGIFNIKRELTKI